MDDSNLYRVIEVGDTHLQLDPIAKRNNHFIDGDDDLVSVSTETAAPSVENILELLDEGHIISASITESGGTHRLTSIEHQGGLTLVELDSRSVPTLIHDYWSEEGKSSQSTFSADRERVVIPLSELVPINEEAGFAGELVLQPELDGDGSSWDDLRNGDGSESIYGTFETHDGTPAEVFIGNPEGERYWYAIRFPEEKTWIAREVRAEYGYLYDDWYIPSPGIDFSQLIDRDKLPADPDQSQREIWAPGYAVPSHRIPPRFGSDTVDLLAELAYIGCDFELMLFAGDDDPFDSDDVCSYSPQYVKSASGSLIDSYRFYTGLVIEICARVQEADESSIEPLVKNGTLPDPELLYQARVQFDRRVHRIECYLEKMKQVPVEAYVLDVLSGPDALEVPEVSDEYTAEGFALLVRHVLYDMEKQLEEVSDVLKVAKYAAEAIHTDDGFTYSIRAEPKAIRYLKQHRGRLLRNLFPADLGGEDPAVYMQLIGRIPRRHPWFDIASLGAGGELLSAFDDAVF